MSSRSIHLVPTYDSLRRDKVYSILFPVQPLPGDLIWMQRLSRSQRRLETQDIKTQPQINHHLKRRVHGWLIAGHFQRNLCCNRFFLPFHANLKESHGKEKKPRETDTLFLVLPFPWAKGLGRKEEIQE